MLAASLVVKAEAAVTKPPINAATMTMIADLHIAATHGLLGNLPERAFTKRTLRQRGENGLTPDHLAILHDNLYPTPIGCWILKLWPSRMHTAPLPFT
jgi:hypothetical protein